MKLNETEIAKPVVDWLKAQGFEVYQEVMYNGHAADIIAVRGEFSWCIECKVSFSTVVIRQAYTWGQITDKQSVAVLYSRKRSEKRYANIDRCQRMNIGIIEVGPEIKIDLFNSTMMVNEIFDSKTPCKLPIDETDKYWRWQLSMKPERTIKDYLFEKQKDYCQAGSQSGALTPFKRSIMKLEQIVNDHPGIQLTDAIRMMEKKHHWSNDQSAFSGISAGIAKGYIASIRKEIGPNKRLVLYPISSDNHLSECAEYMNLVSCETIKR